MYSLIIISIILCFFLVCFLSSKKSNSSDEQLNGYDWIGLILIILLIVFIIKDISAVVTIVKYPTYESEIEALKQEIKEIDETMKGIYITNFPEEYKMAMNEDVDLEGKYAELVYANKTFRENISDLKRTFDDDKKTIKKLEKKKNNISMYKKLVFPLWK